MLIVIVSSNYSPSRRSEIKLIWFPCTSTCSPLFFWGLGQAEALQATLTCTLWANSTGSIPNSSKFLTKVTYSQKKYSVHMTNEVMYPEKILRTHETWRTLAKENAIYTQEMLYCSQSKWSLHIGNAAWYPEQILYTQVINCMVPRANIRFSPEMLYRTKSK